MQVLDLTGALCSFICTYLFTKTSKIGWIFYLLAATINLSLYYQKGIYGNMFLDMFYISTAFYGAYNWGIFNSRNKQKSQSITVKKAEYISKDKNKDKDKDKDKIKDENKIKILNNKERVNLITSFILLTIISYVILSTFTDSNIPFWDASITALSLLAHLMVCNKVLENWLIWGFIDACKVGIQLHKDIPVHAGLHVLYLALAVKGFNNWYSIYKQQQINTISQKTGAYLPKYNTKTTGHDEDDGASKQTTVTKVKLDLK